ncbi:MAG: TatD family hydrolase [Pseudoflavonifractor sp.]|nr:TatD family hydrolase [Pseudoflavonifractor sp.]
MMQPIEIIDIHTHHGEGTPLVVYNNGYRPVRADAIGYYSVGLHPWDADKPFSRERLLDMARDTRVVAIGETGIDPLRGPSVDDIQLPVFVSHIDVARQLGKPLIIHLVRQWDTLLRLHRDMRSHMPWVIHGFRGKPQLVNSLTSRGIHLSIGARFNPDAVKAIPDSLLLLETDDMADRDITSILHDVADARGVTPRQLAKTVNANAALVFGISLADTVSPHAPAGEQ